MRTGTKIAIGIEIVCLGLIVWLLVGVVLLSARFPHLAAFAPYLSPLIISLSAVAGGSYVASETRKTIEGKLEPTQPADAVSDTHIGFERTENFDEEES